MAAEAVLDIALHNHHPHDGPRVFHVVNTDTSTSWGSVLDWIQQRAGASFERVPPSEWVNRLAATDESPANPSWKLLGLWEASVSLLLSPAGVCLCMCVLMEGGGNNK